MALPLIAAIAAGAAVAGAAGGGLAKVGKNNFHSNSFADTKEYDPNRFNYAGDPEGAKKEAFKYNNWAKLAYDRQGPQLNQEFVNQRRWDDAEARRNQMGIAGLMDQRARGLTPSIAQMQADRQMGQLAAAQNSAAASARGPAAIALAQQNAMGATQAGSANISANAQIAAAQERLAAEQAAFGAHSGIRGGDQAGQNLEQSFAGKQGDLDLGMRGMNDQFALGMSGLEHSVYQDQLGAGVNQQNMLARDKQSADEINFRVNQGNADKETQRMNGMLGGVGGALSGMMSDVNAKQNVSQLGGPSGATYSGLAGIQPQMQQQAQPAPQMQQAQQQMPAANPYQSNPQQQQPMQSTTPQNPQVMTSQLANGLAPYSYQYRPGMGPPGQQVGPMAQNMAANPVTAPAVMQNPQNGLLNIDRDAALKASLAGVGHLAQRQQQTDQALGLASPMQQRPGMYAQRGMPFRRYG